MAGNGLIFGIELKVKQHDQLVEWLGSQTLAHFLVLQFYVLLLKRLQVCVSVSMQKLVFTPVEGCPSGLGARHRRLTYPLLARYAPFLLEI